MIGLEAPGGIGAGRRVCTRVTQQNPKTIRAYFMDRIKDNTTPRKRRERNDSSWRMLWIPMEKCYGFGWRCRGFGWRCSGFLLEKTCDHDIFIIFFHDISAVKVWFVVILGTKTI